MVPGIVASFYMESYLSSWVAATLFSFASLTDFFDGYLARTWKVQSQLGKIFDPVADKLVVTSAIVMIIHADLVSNLGVIPALAIICREILVSGLREFLGKVDVAIPVAGIAKIKTFLQMAAVILLIISRNLPSMNALGEFLLWVAALLTLISGYGYFRTSLKYI